MLAKAGVPVFPCAPGGKQPLTSRGFHNATVDVECVSAWWRRWPEANVGLPTGGASAVDVVDVDVHDGGNGFAAFERARSAGLVEGWAWLVRTPSGGVHAYFLRSRTGGPAGQRSWQVFDRHVDFRGDGGYVIVPPSRIGEATYALIAVTQHQPRPVDAAALRRFLEPPRTQLPAPRGASRDARPDRLAAWVAGRSEGARNHGLYWAACRMVEGGHDFTEALATLGPAAESAGLPQREAETTIRSAYRTTASHSARASRPGPTRTTVEAVEL